LNQRLLALREEGTQQTAIARRAARTASTTTPVEVAGAEHDRQERHDRLGATGAQGASPPTEKLNRWDEIAQILSRLLRQETGGSAHSSPAVAVRSGLPPVGVIAQQEAQDIAGAEPEPLQQTNVGTAADDQDVPGTLPTPPEQDDAGVELSAEVEEAESEDLDVEPESETPGSPDGVGQPIGSAIEGGTPDSSAPAGEGSHQMIVRQWQDGVAAAGGGLPTPSVEVDAGRRSARDTAAGIARTRNSVTREAAPADAMSNVAQAPDTEGAPAPAPLPANPVPGHTNRITQLSDRRLPEQVAPLLERSPRRMVEGVEIGGSFPNLTERPVASDLFQALTNPRARELAQIPTGEMGENGELTPEAQRMQDALDLLTAEPLTDLEQVPGESVITPDRGAPPPAPLPAALGTNVGEVVARLLAQLDDATTDSLDQLRTSAYRGGVLKTNFPEIGAELATGLRTALDTDLRLIAESAGVSSERLAAMITDREDALKESAGEAIASAASAGEEISQGAVDDAQETMDTIEGAARAADGELLQRREAAGGQADPAVIKRRRDAAVAWIREQVTGQITSYQQVGDRRVRELTMIQTKQVNGYQALAQREQYQVLTPQGSRAARDTSNANRERILADTVALIRTWSETKVRTLNERFRTRLIGVARTKTTTYRREIEAAGSVGIEAARTWAENKIYDGESWWSLMLRRIERWFDEANDANETWRVRRTTQNRDTAAIELNLINQAQELIEQGLTEEQVLGNEALNAAQRAVIRDFFARPADAHPLDFAADRMRRNVANDQLDHARGVFEREMMGMSVSRGDYATPEKLQAVAVAEGGAFDGAGIAQRVHGAMDQIGTDEAAIFSALNGLTPLKGAIVRKFYTARYGGSLDYDLRDELSGDEYQRAVAQVSGNQSRADAVALHDAIAGWGTDEAAIMELLRNKTPAEVEAIRASYQARYGESLDAALAGDLDEGNEIDQANALMAGDTATADAIALDESMRGGFLGLGTSEEEIESVYARVRSEVHARAQSERWTAAEMEAEVRRRLGAIEQRFGDRYANVEQYNAPGLQGGSVLERAFSSELSGPERDLANALQDNDLIRADAARIEVERLGFYASDENINGVLRSQYERALEATRLDEGPARQMKIHREVDRLRSSRDPVYSAEEISRIRMRMERDAEHAMQDEAQSRSEMSMQQLGEVYQDNYTWPLDFVVSWNTSGNERGRAQSLLAQGGRLDPLQEIEYATRVYGSTDEDALRRTLSVMTQDEIRVVAREWERRHPGQSFYAMLRGELSGRDESDIMDMAHHGAPESAMEQIEQERRRVDRELNDLTGPLGGAAAVNESAWMRHQMNQLEQLSGPLQRIDWPNTDAARAERVALQGQVAERTERVQAAVQDRRRRIDSVTDVATQVVGIAVGLTVALVLGAVSGGTLGVATIALMASIMATASTMATKALIKGGAYGIEEVGVDLAVGVVDAITSVATAGMGSRLLGPMQRALGRVPLNRVAGMIGRTGLAQRLARAPGVGAVGRMASRFAPSRAAIERGAASFIAEGIEDAAGAVPAALAQTALDDNTWSGNALVAFLESGGMAILQGVAMGRMMAGGMNVGGRALRGIRGEFRMGSDVGRLREGNRLLQEGFGSFARENPGASHADFLAHPAGRSLISDLQTRGLLPTLESVARRVQDAGSRDRWAADGTPLDPATARMEDLTAALPQNTREGTFVTPDSTLTGNSVSVEPLRIGNRIVGVDVRVGPDATPLDVALHAATVDSMQRYRGVLGNLRRALVDAAAIVTRSGLRVGSAGWEARFELGKLSAILATRMDEYAGSTHLSPRARADILADVNHLQNQVQGHHNTLQDPALRGAPGRGFVAAEGLSRGVDSGRLQQGGELTELGHALLAQRLEGVIDAFHAELHAHRRALQNADPVARGYDPEADGPMLAEVAQIASEFNLDFDAVLGIVRAGELPQQFHSRPDPTRVDADSVTDSPSNSTARHPDQVELDSLLDQIQAPHPDSPDALVDRVRMGGTGGDAAQQKINEQSRAPTDAEVRNVTPEVIRDAAAFPDIDQPGGDRYLERYVVVDGLEMRIYRSRPTLQNPHPEIRFEASLPRWTGRPVVYQFGHGELRVWRSRPDGDGPGLEMQESIVGPRRARSGYEDHMYSHGEGGFAGGVLERGHAHGAGLRVESPFGITLLPREVNQILQARGIEAYMRRLRDSLPPGATLLYQTSVRRQTDAASRLAEVVYMLDIHFMGERLPFAEFGIHVEGDPPGTPRHLREGTRSITVDPLEWRGYGGGDLTSPLPGGQTMSGRQVNRLLQHLREAVDLPQTLLHGLPRQTSPDLATAQILFSSHSAQWVNTQVANHPFMTAHPPGAAREFEFDYWVDGLRDRLDDSSRLDLIVVDLRDSNLLNSEIDQIVNYVDSLEPRDFSRVVVIQ